MKSYFEEQPSHLMWSSKRLQEELNIKSSRAAVIMNAIRDLAEEGFYPEWVHIGAYRSRFVSKWAVYHYIKYEHLFTNKWVKHKDIPSFDPMEIYSAIDGRPCTICEF